MHNCAYWSSNENVSIRQTCWGRSYMTQITLCVELQFEFSHRKSMLKSCEPCVLTIGVEAIERLDYLIISTADKQYQFLLYPFIVGGLFFQTSICPVADKSKWAATSSCHCERWVARKWRWMEHTEHPASRH